ncbi:SRPBCC family protein [Streptomyces sp. NPDC004311]|uniref:SRPBCC family protein n=1 Tax=Streptomyces sp. NPDC004311 TaxID=3364698 RepID=UPI0036B14D8D
MSQVEESVEVDVPVRTAYNQWTQFESFPHFMGRAHRAAHQHHDALTEQIPDERVAWTALGSAVKQAGVVTFHRLAENKTKVMLQLDFDPDGIAENVGDKLGFVKRQITGDLKRFKDYIEKHGQETGGWRGKV